MFENLIDNKFVDKGDKILVGVSGGADSMLLLWSLIDKQKEFGFDMVVVHVNHGIRNDTAERDQLFVEEFCKKRKIKQISVKIDTKKCKTTEKFTLEEAARVLRYEAFDKILKTENCNKLFLAHHKNDQAETILMHIFRGCGISGACGIKQSEKIKRPLLDLTKSEILKICNKHGIQFVEDETNNDNYYARNFVRNEILPTIEKVYPGVVDSICRFGERCEEIQRYIELMLSSDLIIQNDKEILLKDAAFENPNFLIKEYIKRVFEKLSIYEDIESKHYLLVTELQKMEVNKQIDLPHRIIAKRTYSGIKFLKTKKSNLKNEEYPFIFGELNFRDIGTIKASLVSLENIIYGEGSLFVDYNKIPNNAVWRTRKQGDVFSKLGTGTKKLNDYFTDKKIDIEKRDRIPILAIGNTVLVVLGEDISENVKIDGKTDKAVAIKFIEN